MTTTEIKEIKESVYNTLINGQRKVEDYITGKTSSLDACIKNMQVYKRENAKRGNKSDVIKRWMEDEQKMFACISGGIIKYASENLLIKECRRIGRKINNRAYKMAI